MLAISAPGPYRLGRCQEKKCRNHCATLRIAVYVFVAIVIKIFELRISGSEGENYNEKDDGRELEDAQNQG